MKTAKARPSKRSGKFVPNKVILQLYGRMVTIDFPIYDLDKGEDTDEHRES
jgi:hypothetical protein